MSGGNDPADNERENTMGRQDLTDSIVDTLCAEAAQAGDYEMVAICERWDEGEATEADVKAIVETIRYAADRRANG